jgi:hypothetical protein
MERSYVELLLWLYIVNLGTVFGAAVYEARIIVPQWSNSLPHSLFRWNAEVRYRPHPTAHFWSLVATVSLTALTVVSLFVAWIVEGVRMDWWLASASLALVERAMTFTYFSPVSKRLEHPEQWPIAEMTREAIQWVRMNYLRTALVFVAWMMALKSLALTTY